MTELQMLWILVWGLISGFVILAIVVGVLGYRQYGKQPRLLFSKTRGNILGAESDYALEVLPVCEFGLDVEIIDRMLDINALRLGLQDVHSRVKKMENCAHKYKFVMVLGVGNEITHYLCRCKCGDEVTLSWEELDKGQQQAALKFLEPSDDEKPKMNGKGSKRRPGKMPSDSPIFKNKKPAYRKTAKEIEANTGTFIFSDGKLIKKSKSS